MKVLDERLALVTGAGRGLGAAIARGLGEVGAKVLVTDVDAALAPRAQPCWQREELAASGEGLDVTDRQALKLFAAMVKKIMAGFRS